MTIVACAALGVAAFALVVSFAGLQVVRAMVREQARERQLLVNQIMHLSGRTWTPPPVEQWAAPDNADQELVAFPEQFPDDHDWDA